MSISRRDFLRVGGFTTAALTLSACSTVGRRLVREGLPETLSTGAALTGSATQVIRRILNRAGYGPRPGDIERVQQMGLATYLEQQLNPDSIDDTATDLIVRGLGPYNLGIDQLFSRDQRDVGIDLARATLTRALTSERQLYEAMVEFWSDHFNVYLRKNKDFVYFKVIDDREVIRPHALGNFRDLLFASAQSPAMLIYLDNISNVASAPNENYARELMELHTLGVDAGYTQDDVQELSRALTGWGVARRGRKQGQFVFNIDAHDNAEKIVLGQRLPAGRGEEDVTDVLDVLASHPSTANFIATKLVRRFVADQPPLVLVETVAGIFLETDGDIKSMLRAIFLSDDFATAPPKLKRPYSFSISALRALRADVGLNGIRQLVEALRLLGQIPYHWPMPDGYPDVAAAWTGNLLARWNFGLALIGGHYNGIRLPLEALAEAGNVSGPSSAVVFFGALLLGTEDEDVIRPLQDYVGNGNLGDGDVRRRLDEAIALMLASPAFQWV